jgi:hypothetical protein
VIGVAKRRCAGIGGVTARRGSLIDVRETVTRRMERLTGCIGFWKKVWGPGKMF